LSTFRTSKCRPTGGLPALEWQKKIISGCKRYIPFVRRGIAEEE